MFYVSGITLRNNNYRGKKAPTADSSLAFSTGINILYQILPRPKFFTFFDKI